MKKFIVSLSLGALLLAPVFAFAATTAPTIPDNFQTLPEAQQITILQSIIANLIAQIQALILQRQQALSSAPATVINPTQPAPTSPVYAQLPIPRNTLTNGTMVLYRFSVTAPPSGDVHLDSFPFRLARTGMVQVGPLSIYGYSDSGFSTIAYSSSPFSTVPSPFLTLLADPTSGNVTFKDFSSQVIVDAGTTKYFEVIGFVLNVPQNAVLTIGLQNLGDQTLTTTLATTQPSIAVLSPSSGPVGTTVTINGSGFSTGDIVYFQGQSVSAIPNRNSPDPGNITSWSFVVPSIPVPPQRQCLPAVTGVMCEVRVANATNGGGNSAWFNVTGGAITTPSITVLTPNGGERLVRGNQTIINWREDGTVTPVNVTLIPTASSPYTYSIATLFPAANGSFSWKVGEAQTIDGTNLKAPDGSYYLKVCSTDTAGISVGTCDSSDAPFSIVAATSVQPSITVLSPNGGEMWQIGNTYNIIWKADRVDSGSRTAIRVVDYSCSSETSALISGSVPAYQGNYSWTIPSDFFTSRASVYCPSYTYNPTTHYGWRSGDNFKIFIAKLTTDGSFGIQDESANYFNIVVPTVTPTPVSIPFLSLSGTGDPPYVIQGNSFTGIVTRALANTPIGLTCTTPSGGSCSPGIIGTTDASGYASKIFSTAGWALGTYSISVTVGTFTSNTVQFTVTVPVAANNPFLSLSATTIAQGASFTGTVTGAAPNASVSIYCRTPQNTSCDDPNPAATDILGRASRTYLTTGWTGGTYSFWAMVNGVISNTMSISVVLPTPSPTPVPSVSFPVNTGDFVAKLYICILERPLDTGGFTVWHNGIVNHTQTFEQEYSGFFNSSEYIGKVTSNSKYVNQLYQCVLYRNTDSTEASYWISELDNGRQTRAQVLNGFLNSAEFTGSVKPRLQSLPVGVGAVPSQSRMASILSAFQQVLQSMSQLLQYVNQ